MELIRRSIKLLKGLALQSNQVKCTDNINIFDYLNIKPTIALNAVIN